MYQKAILFAVGFVQALVACGPVAEPLSGTLSSQGFDAYLGEGYDLDQDRLMSTGCVDYDVGSVTPDPPAIGQVRYATNMNYAAVANTINGSAELQLDLQSFDVEGKVDFASEFRKTDFITSLVISYSMENGRIRIPLEQPGKFRLNVTGEQLAERFTAAEFRRHCGSHFVVQKNFGATFIGALIFRFASVTDKMKFDAKIAVEIAGFGGGSAEVHTILNKVAESASIKFRAFQEGGVPREMTSVLTPYMADCSGQNREACFQAFEAMRRYVAEDFPSQFRNGDALDALRFAIRGYETATYDALQDPRLQEAKIDDAYVSKLVAARQDLANDVMDDLANRSLAEGLVDAHGVRDAAQRQRVIRVIDNIDERLKLFRAALDPCYGPAVDLAACLQSLKDGRKDAERFRYDPSDLVVVSTSLEDSCGKLKAWHEVVNRQVESEAEAQGRLAIANALLDEDTRSALVTILNTPQIKALAGRGRTVEIYAKDLDSDGKISPDAPAFDCAAYGAAAYAVTGLTLANSHIGNVDGLAALPYLRTLDLSDNFFPGGVTVLGQLRYLETLNLSHSHLDVLDGLGNPTLERLDLRDNLVSNAELKKLAGAKSLKVLNLSSNGRISDPTTLPDLPKLEILDLQGTRTTREHVIELLTRVDQRRLPRLASLLLPSGACDLIVHPQVTVACQ